jgi:hypothetical protein
MDINPLLRRVSPRVRNSASKVIHNLHVHRKVVLAVLFLFSAFYWYEVRPVRIHRSCSVQASVDAKNLLQSKALIATDPARKKSYEDLAAKNMYLRSDHESFYAKCLRHYAMEN